MVECSEKEESQPFLELHDTSCPRCREGREPQRNGTLRRWQWIASAAIALNLLMLAVAAFALFIPGTIRCLAQDPIGASLYSPLAEGTRYREENRKQAHWQKELYMDPPTAESEQAWDDLTEHPRPVYIPAPEARRLGFQELPDSAGANNGSFLVSVSVFHQLHCLRSIRMSFYADYFFGNRSQEEIDERREHNLHCLEAIRSAVACNADTTAYPLLWKDGKPNTQLMLNSAINRKCVDLEALKVEMDRFVLSS